MKTPPLTIAFHVGVHKTATSHLQRSLSKAAVGLAVKGVRFYGPKQFRAPGATIPARFGLRKDKVIPAAQMSPEAALADLRLDGHRLVLSEENYIGALNHPRGFALKTRYGDAGARLGAFAQAVGQDVDVCLAVRRPTAFLNSAYCQMLLGGRAQTVSLYQKRNPIGSIDWVRLVAEIRAARGIGQVTVWRYEDYDAVFPQIVSRLVGTDVADRVVPIPRFVNRGLSAQAVTAVLEAPTETLQGKAAFNARKAFPVEDGYPSFDGFVPQEHEIGDAIYARQIKAIADIDGVTLLRPDNA